MVEGCRRPGCCGVASLTGHRQLCGNVVGALCGLIGRLMAREALERSIPEDTVLVTRNAGDGPVAPRQRKHGSCMIEA